MAAFPVAGRARSNACSRTVVPTPSWMRSRLGWLAKCGDSSRTNSRAPEEARPRTCEKQSRCPYLRLWDRAFSQSGRAGCRGCPGVMGEGDYSPCMEAWHDDDFNTEGAVDRERVRACRFCTCSGVVRGRVPA